MICNHLKQMLINQQDMKKNSEGPIETMGYKPFHTHHIDKSTTINHINNNQHIISPYGCFSK